MTLTLVQTRRLSSALLVAASILAAGATPAIPQATAEDLSDYLGTWKLDAEFQGNALQMTLEIVELEDVVKAALSMQMSPEPQLIEELSRTEEGIDLAWEADFGGQSIRLHLKGTLEGEELVGAFGDEGGFFEAPFRGGRAAEAADIVVAAAEAAAERALQPQRRQRFGGTSEASMIFGDGKVRITFGKFQLGTPDHEWFERLAPGEVFQFPGTRCFKLLTDVDLYFGDTKVAAHNVSPDYPGVYGLWLKKTEDGWKLVFNTLADVWGTMHEPAGDVTEVALVTEELSEVQEQLSFEVLADDDGEGGLLRVAWDRQAMTAKFRVGS